MRSRAYLVAVACGLVPLAAGAAVFAAGAATRSPRVSALAIGLVYLVPLSVLGGLVALSVNWSRESVRGPDYRPRLVRKTVLAALLLLANVPAGVYLFARGVDAATSYTLLVTNEGEEVTAFTVYGGSVEAGFGSLAPGQSKELSFQLRAGDDKLACYGFRGGQRIEAPVDDIAFAHLGRRVHLRIRADGSVDVEH